MTTTTQSLEERYERRLLAACNRLAARMGCVFVKNERWPDVIRTRASEEG